MTSCSTSSATAPDGGACCDDPAPEVPDRDDADRHGARPVRVLSPGNVFDRERPGREDRGLFRRAVQRKRAAKVERLIEAAELTTSDFAKLFPGHNTSLHLSVSRLTRLRSVIRNQLLQIRIFNLRLLQERDVGIGVFPQGQEILVRSSSLGCVALQGVRAA